MSQKKIFQGSTIVGAIVLFVVFAWLPLVPCSYTGPERVGSETIISANMVCPINPFLVRNTQSETYSYFNIFERNNFLHVTLLYFVNLVLALFLSWFFLQWIPSKLNKKE